MLTLDADMPPVWPTHRIEKTLYSMVIIFHDFEVSRALTQLPGYAAIHCSLMPYATHWMDVPLCKTQTTIKPTHTNKNK